MCEHGNLTLLPTPDWLWDTRADPTKGIAVDSCIAEYVFDAWDFGVRTLGSCCGHFLANHSIVLTEDKEQPALARAVLRGWEIFQWQLVDVSKEKSIWQVGMLMNVTDVRKMLGA